MIIFERVQTGLVIVLRLITILGFQNQASTQPKIHTFKIRLESVPPLRQNLNEFKLKQKFFSLNLKNKNVNLQVRLKNNNTCFLQKKNWTKTKSVLR